MPKNRSIIAEVRSKANARPQSTPRDQLARCMPRFLQPAITWISGKALDGQAPLIPQLCRPGFKVCVAAFSVGLGLLCGVGFDNSFV
jgi:hypothetical protein